MAVNFGNGRMNSAILSSDIINITDVSVNEVLGGRHEAIAVPKQFSILSDTDLQVASADVTIPYIITPVYGKAIRSAEVLLSTLIGTRCDMGTASFSIEWWAETGDVATVASNVPFCFSIGLTSTPRIACCFGLYNAERRVRFDIKTAGGTYLVSSSLYLDVSAATENNKLHHFVALVNRADGKVYIYIDAVLFGAISFTNTGDSIELSSATGRIVFGGLSEVAASGGHVADAKIYSSLLTLAEIQRLNSYGPGECPLTLSPGVAMTLPQVWISVQHRSIWTDSRYPEVFSVGSDGTLTKLCALSTAIGSFVLADNLENWSPGKFAGYNKSFLCNANVEYRMSAGSTGYISHYCAPDASATIRIASLP